MKTHSVAPPPRRIVLHPSGLTSRAVLRLLLLTLAASACDRPVTAPEGTLGGDGLLLSRSAGPLTERGQPVDYNERLARIADQLPGYGGHFTEDGQLIVWLTDDGATQEEARDVIGDFRRTSASGHPEFAERRAAAAATMVSRRGDYDFRQLYAWYGQLRRPLWSIDGVHWTDIDERANRITVGVREERAIDDVAAVVEDLSIPAGAVVAVHDPGSLVAQSDTLDTVVPFKRNGIQISPSTNPEFDSCTLGFSVPGPADAFWYFVTASHCSRNFGTLDGDTLGQPTINLRLGVEVSDPPFWTSATDSTCTPNFKCRRSDAALYRYNTWDFLHGFVAWPDLSQQGGAGYDKEFSTSVGILIAFDAEVGDTVQKVGRTTGRTKGAVLNTCIDQTDVLNGVQILCGWKANYQSLGGDSGGPVLWIDPADPSFRVAVGLHQGGYTEAALAIFSATSQWKFEISSDFGGSYCVDDACGPAPLASITSGPTVVPSTFHLCQWAASATRGIPPYTYTWSGVASGTGKTLNASVSGSGWLNVEVKDQMNKTDTESIFITVDPGAPDPPGCAL